jgi:hypothetical protein
VTGQHLLLLLWTLWLVFALLFIGDLLGVILALVFGLLGAGLVLTGLATWRGYIIAGLVVHVLVAAYAVAVLRAWLRPASGRLGLRTLWDWPQNPLLQTIFGSVSFVGLVSLLFLRPTVPWKYSADIPIMILVVVAVVAVEYALLAGSGFRHPVRPEQSDDAVKQEPSDNPATEEQPGQAEPERSPAGSESGAGVAASNGDTMVGKVVPPDEPADTEAENRERINGLDLRLGHVENRIYLLQQAQVPAPSALESEPPVWLHASGEIGSWAKSDAPGTGAFSVQLLRIARLVMRQAGSTGIAGRVVGINGMADRVVGITIERRMVPISLEPGEKVRHVVARVAETLSHEIETCATAPGTTQPIRPPAWKGVSARWVQAGLTGVNTAARTAADLGADLDSILCGKPVPPVFSWNAPGSAAAVIGKDAETRQILRFGGIVMGTKSDRLVAISACFRSLARDDFTRSLAAEIANELGTRELSSESPSPHMLVG